MPSNVEFKARLHDPTSAHAVARQLSPRDPEILRQRDVFFKCPDGRLKLRIFDDGSGELILYRRLNSSGPRRSDYVIARTPDPEILLGILRQTLRCVGTVKKTRAVYLAAQTRIHIDQVEGLGDFLEIEVVLRPEQSEDEGQCIAREMLKQFNITPGQLVGIAYVDLLTVSPAI